MEQRVVFCLLLTADTFSPTKALRRVLFPTFGAPHKPTVITRFPVYSYPWIHSHRKRYWIIFSVFLNKISDGWKILNNFFRQSIMGCVMVFWFIIQNVIKPLKYSLSTNQTGMNENKQGFFFFRCYFNRFFSGKQSIDWDDDLSHTLPKTDDKRQEMSGDIMVNFEEVYARDEAFNEKTIKIRIKKCPCRDSNTGYHGHNVMYWPTILQWHLVKVE